MFMATTTTIRARIVPASMLMPNTRASIVKSSGLMKRKAFTFTGAPRKIVASPALMAVLRRLDAKHARQSTPNNEELLTKRGDSRPL